MRLVLEERDLLLYLKKYPKGFLFIDDSSLPEDVRNYAERNLKKGQILKEKDLVFKSPGDGLSPAYLDLLLGKKLKKNLKEDEALKLNYV